MLLSADAVIMIWHSAVYQHWAFDSGRAIMQTHTTQVCSNYNSTRIVVEGMHQHHVDEMSTSTSTTVCIGWPVRWLLVHQLNTFCWTCLLINEIEGCWTEITRHYTTGLQVLVVFISTCCMRNFSGAWDFCVVLWSGQICLTGVGFNLFQWLARSL